MHATLPLPKNAQECPPSATPQHSPIHIGLTHAPALRMRIALSTTGSHKFPPSIPHSSITSSMLRSLLSRLRWSALTHTPLADTSRFQLRGGLTRQAHKHTPCSCIRPCQAAACNIFTSLPSFDGGVSAVGSAAAEHVKLPPAVTSERHMKPLVPHETA